MVLDVFASIAMLEGFIAVALIDLPLLLELLFILLLNGMCTAFNGLNLTSTLCFSQECRNTNLFAFGHKNSVTKCIHFVGTVYAAYRNLETGA